MNPWRTHKDEAPYFSTSIGNYTGECAVSLDDFVRKIVEVYIISIESHLVREDFEKWVTETLENEELAQEIRKLQKQKSTGRFLREKLQAIVSQRLVQLEHMF